MLFHPLVLAKWRRKATPVAADPAEPAAAAARATAAPQTAPQPAAAARPASRTFPRLMPKEDDLPPAPGILARTSQLLAGWLLVIFAGVGLTFAFPQVGVAAIVFGFWAPPLLFVIVRRVAVSFTARPKRLADGWPDPFERLYERVAAGEA